MAGKDVLSYFSRDVLQWHIHDFNVETWEFMRAVREINKSYNPQVMAQCEERNQLNYNHPAFRCAYLHKYSIHTAAVRDFAAENREIFREVLNDRYSMNICCLGGGPGSDIIGLSAEFCNWPESFGKYFKFTTVDYMGGWKYVCDDVFNAANPARLGRFGEFLKTQVLHSFIIGDMRRPSEETVQAIRCADVLSMVKFVSALDKNVAFNILQNVYLRMKPGALVIFLENSGGGTYQIAEDAAKACGLQEVGIFHRHLDYQNPDFYDVMCEERSRDSIKIALKIWKKQNYVL